MLRYLSFISLALALTPNPVLGAWSIPGNIDLTKSPKTEPELLEVLRSDAPLAEKAPTCKLLAVYGSGAAVPELAKLLPDQKLSSWARIALEAIPDPACDQALREAASALRGKLLVGVVNSIGVRQDVQAIGILANHLRGQDVQVASAAAVALGHIGGADAVETLLPALTGGPQPLRSAVAEGCILCAEQFLSQGDHARAAKLYDAVRAAEVPHQRVLEATRGAILARGQQGIPLLLEQLHSDQQSDFYMALSTAREFPGQDLDQALAEELEKSTPERAALIVVAMADRPDTVNVPRLLQAANQGPEVVRAAAVAALGRVGDVSCLRSLLDIASKDNRQLADTAKQSLAEIPAAGVNDRVLELLPAAQGAIYPVLLEVVGTRRIEATPLLVQALEQDDPHVRSAALIAMGETITLDQLSLLIEQVAKPVHPKDQSVALQALQAASIRMADREACAAQLTAAIEQVDSSETKSEYLRILGAMGGTNALKTIAAAAGSNDSQLQDVATQLLGKWMTDDAAPVLLDLAQKLSPGKYQIRALRGYIRIARQFNLAQERRSEMCRIALETAERAKEQEMVLEVLKRYPNPENLKLASRATEIPAVSTQATAIAKHISRELEKSEN